MKIAMNRRDVLKNFPLAAVALVGSTAPVLVPARKEPVKLFDKVYGHWESVSKWADMPVCDCNDHEHHHASMILISRMGLAFIDHRTPFDISGVLYGDKTKWSGHFFIQELVESSDHGLRHYFTIIDATSVSMIKDAHEYIGHSRRWYASHRPHFGYAGWLAKKDHPDLVALIESMKCPA